MGFDANEMCCVCGGGLRDDDEDENGRESQEDNDNGEDNQGDSGEDDHGDNRNSDQQDCPNQTECFCECDDDDYPCLEQCYDILSDIFGLDGSGVPEPLEPEGIACTE